MKNEKDFENYVRELGRQGIRKKNRRIAMISGFSGTLSLALVVVMVAIITSNIFKAPEHSGMSNGQRPVSVVDANAGTKVTYANNEVTDTESMHQPDGIEEIEASMNEVSISGIDASGNRPLDCIMIELKGHGYEGRYLIQNAQYRELISWVCGLDLGNEISKEELVELEGDYFYLYLPALQEDSTQDAYFILNGHLSRDDQNYYEIASDEYDTIFDILTFLNDSLEE